MRGEWIEISTQPITFDAETSRPVRGEWIEIPIMLLIVRITSVSPREGRVD